MTKVTWLLVLGAVFNENKINNKKYMTRLHGYMVTWLLVLGAVKCETAALC
jgi:hypothetical protein